MNIDMNIVLDDTGDVSCAHCAAPLGHTSADPLALAIRNERESTEAGPGVHADPRLFTDRRIVLRQTFCPQCLVLLVTEIVPADEPAYRSWSVTR
jgi:hypothetical protein